MLKLVKLTIYFYLINLKIGLKISLQISFILSLTFSFNLRNVFYKLIAHLG